MAAPTDNLGRPLTPGLFRSIAAIKRANKARGHVWFDRSHVTALQETTLPTVYAGCVFAVSQIDEHNPGHGRTYRLAAVQPNGDVTYADNMHHATPAAVVRAAQALADVIERAAAEARS